MKSNLKPNAHTHHNYESKLHLYITSWHRFHCHIYYISKPLPHNKLLPQLSCCIFGSCYSIQSALAQKGKAHTCCVGMLGIWAFIQHTCASPLTEVLHYSTSKLVMQLKYAPEHCSIYTWDAWPQLCYLHQHMVTGNLADLPSLLCTPRCSVYYTQSILHDDESMDTLTMHYF